MNFTFARDMQGDLLAVDSLFKKSLFPWWDDISIYIDNMDADFTFNMLPAMVIAAYRNLGLNKELNLAMANLFKTIYFANRIHVLIKDDEEGQLQNQELQFTILIGDYIFGRILKLLLEAKADRLLKIFSAMMCEMNEGLVVQYKLDGDLQQTLAMTRASLYSSAFITAAQMAGLEENKIVIYGEIGRNLGMALEIKYNYGQDNRGYLYEAERLLEQFNTSKTTPIHSVIKDLLRDVTSFDAVAVG